MAQLYNFKHVQTTKKNLIENSTYSQIFHIYIESYRKCTIHRYVYLSVSVRKDVGTSEILLEHKLREVTNYRIRVNVFVDIYVCVCGICMARNLFKLQLSTWLTFSIKMFSCLGMRGP